MKDWAVRSHWTFNDKLAAFMAFLGVVWFCLPTSLMIVPGSLAVSYNNVAHPQFRFERTVPFVPVWAKTTVDVYGPYDDCQQTVDRVWYQKADHVYYYLDSGGDRCIVPGERFTLTTKREVIIAGPLKMRASTTSWSCPATSGPCQPVLR